MLVLLLLSKLWLVYSAFSFQTHIIFKAVAVWTVKPWCLVDRCQRFGRICRLHIHIITVPPQDHNLINYRDKVKCFVPVLNAPGAWPPVLPQWATASSPALSLNGEHTLSTTSGRGCWQNISCQLDHSNTNSFLYLPINLAILYTERE